MRKFAFTAAALAAMTMVGLEMNTAQASHGFNSFGLHIGGRNVNFSVGSTQGYRHPGHAVYRRPYSNPRWYGRENCPSSRTSYRWYDTSHWDYLPGGYVRHYGYVPSRHVWHRDGHWDVHHGRHHGRRH